MKHKFLAAIFLVVTWGITKAQQQHYLLTGTYTSGKSEGIYVYQFNSDVGTAKAVSSVKISNPSFVAISPNDRFVYSVEENAGNKGNGGSITAFSFDKTTGILTFINRQSSAGDHPCYVSVDKTGKWVAAGNYTSGSLSILPVMGDGSIGEARTIIKHAGSGFNTARQASPHVHGTFFSPDNRFLLVPDLGIDKVMIYAFDETTGILTAAKQSFAESGPGTGPRHISFHPSNKYAYLLQELSGTVTVFTYKKGKLRKRQAISSMPAGDTSFAGSADIHVSPDGKFLYASNRAASNTIAIFSINQKNGQLSPAGHQSTLGKTPRNFNFDPTGNFLLVANQNSDQVVIFKINKETGQLTDTGNRIEVGKPVCLKWISVQ
ncbi:MAG: lactonase family protein [Ferruginibacter sp.]|nr:lactonase family protein [Chitinophagaceae bacterium]